HGKVVLFGGTSGYPNSGTIRVGLNDTWLWDGTNWTKAAPSSSPPVENARLAYDETYKQVVYFGGGSGDTWTWDGTNWTQKSPAGSPAARSYAGLAYDASRGGRLLFGGTGTSGALSDTWLWNGTTWSQQTTSTVPPGQHPLGLSADTATGGVEFVDATVLPPTTIWIWQ